MSLFVIVAGSSLWEMMADLARYTGIPRPLHSWSLLTNHLVGSLGLCVLMSLGNLSFNGLLLYNRVTDETPNFLPWVDLILAVTLVLDSLELGQQLTK